MEECRVALLILNSEECRQDTLHATHVGQYLFVCYHGGCLEERGNCILSEMLTVYTLTCGFQTRMLVLRGTTRSVPLFISQEKGIFEGEFVNCKNKVFSSFISLETRYVVGPTTYKYMFCMFSWLKNEQHIEKLNAFYFFFINLRVKPACTWNIWIHCPLVEFVWILTFKTVKLIYFVLTVAQYLVKFLQFISKNICQFLFHWNQWRDIYWWWSVRLYEKWTSVAESQNGVNAVENQKGAFIIDFVCSNSALVFSVEHCLIYALLSLN